MKRFLLTSSLMCTVLATGAARADDAALKAAIADSQRTPANVARDAYRHPYETLSFFGIQPTMTVVELSPGGGWYTEILAPYLHDQGKLITAGSDPKSDDEDTRRDAGLFQDKLDSKPAVYGKVQKAVFTVPTRVTFAGRGSVDMVLTFRNIHNWIDIGGDDATQKVFASAYAALKPGGVFGIVEHRLPASLFQNENASTGYVHQDYVIKMAQSVGFKLAGTSEINANPKDNANHKGGVWALPPSYKNGDEDRAIYRDIGESDRMTLKFVKP
jgi:predicted methyltransferase